MSTSRRRVVLVQLPIPPVGPQPVRGNVPLAAGFLKLFARSRGLETEFDIDILPLAAANTLSDQGLVEDLAARRPWMVGFTCYLWNIDRTLLVARRLKQRLPAVRVVLGGPEITADNAWVLDSPVVDYAAIGEGEQTFADLLAAAAEGNIRPGAIDGLYVRPQSLPIPDGSLAAANASLSQPPTIPRPRAPLANLDVVSSPYLAGILDAADEEMMLLETVRGCIFKCKFCYYPKSYDALYFVSRERVATNLEYARRRGVREVVLLDPTLNQRRDFADLLRLLAEGNPDRQFTYFGELRGEGITPETARLLAEANFTEVEIGLQSVDARAQDLMDRPNNLRAFERGARAMLDAGIRVKVDLIIGLPGDTAESIRRGIEYLVDTGFCRNSQVFQLAVLPGTAFRQEAAALGLRYQARPPYYVLQTPTLELAEMVDLMREAQERIGIEFDAPSEPVLEFDERSSPLSVWRVDLDAAGAATNGHGADRAFSGSDGLPDAASIAQAFTLWMRSADFDASGDRAAAVIARVLSDNPHTTLQIVLEPTGDLRRLSATTLEAIRQACYRAPSYLDRFYSMAPGRLAGAKRLVVLCPPGARDPVDARRLAEVGEYATIVWQSDDRSPASGCQTSLSAAR